MTQYDTIEEAQQANPNATEFVAVDNGVRRWTVIDVVETPVELMTHQTPEEHYDV